MEVPTHQNLCTQKSSQVEFDLASISFTSAGAVLPPRQEKTPGWATLKPTAPFQPQQAACRLVLRCSCSGRFIGVTFVTSKHTKQARFSRMERNP